MVIKTAVIGASGFVGGHLLQAYRTTYPDSVGTGFTRSRQGVQYLDLCSPEIDCVALEASGHQAVLIAAANANIGYCERYPDAAHAVNVRGTLALVDSIAETSMKVIFLSSDYVFDGRKGGYGDATPPNPITEYGRHKATVESQLPDHSDNWLVLRLSKVLGLDKGDGTLLDEIASSLTRAEPIRAATDQLFCPTLVADLVEAIINVQNRDLRGILNVCGPEATSRFELAARLALELGVDADLVEPVSLHDLDGMAGRPLNTTLICERLAIESPTVFTPLENSIRRVATNWGAAG